MMSNAQNNAQQPWAVEVKQLSVVFDDFYAVKNVTFSVKRGEIFGFLGANGAGKTTTIRVLCGLLNPSEGEVRVGGILFENGVSEKKIKEKVGYMSQRLTLYPDLTVEENLAFTASLRKLSKRQYHHQRDEILAFISFQQPRSTLVQSLSGGMKQQVSLAASLLHDPEIVFLDEPTAGVTPASREKFWALIKKIAESGRTVFVTSHYMDEVEQCDRIALMRFGEIVALDSPENLKMHLFPEGVYECRPKRSMAYAEIQALRKRTEFEFFEPFGLRFHASFKKTPEAESLRKSLSDDFDMEKIKATLEDVFIRTVESRGDQAFGDKASGEREAVQ